MRSPAIFVCLTICLADAASSAVQVLEPAPIRLVLDKTGGGTFTLTLTTDSADPEKLQLRLTDFAQQRGQEPAYSVGSATLTASAAQVTRDAPVTVKIAVPAISEAGESTASLYQGTKQIASLKALRIPASYNVQLDPSGAEALRAPGSRPVVTLANMDPFTHTFRWRLLTAFGKERPDVGELLTLPANGTVTIDLTAALDEPGFLNAGTLRDEIHPAQLILRPEIPSASGVPPQPAKRLPIKIRAQFWRQPWQQAAGFFVTLLLLALGGMASLFYRSFIPNAMETRRLSRMLREFAQKLAGTGDLLDSRWRVLLEYSLDECRDRLKSGSSILPSFATTLQEARKQLETCGEWIDIAYGISLVRQQAQSVVQTGIPPSLLAMIEERCEDALKPMETGFTKPEEIQAMKADLAWVNATLEAFCDGKPIPELEAVIKERETRLSPQLPALRTVSFPDFAALLSQLENLIQQPLSPALYLDRDTFSLKAELLMEYRDLTLRAGATAFPPAAVAGAAAGGGTAVPQLPGALTRILARDEVFRSYVRPDAHQSLELARIFISEMRQDFYPQAMAAEAAKTPPGLEIVAEPPKVLAGMPVRLLLRFTRHELNEIAALREWMPRWDFGDGERRESGWSVYCIYPGPGVKNIRVSLQKLDGEPACADVTMQLTVGEAIEGVHAARGWTRIWDANKLEVGRLGFALALALLGLYATARDQAASLGLLEGAAAVIALGFAADIAKQLLIARQET